MTVLRILPHLAGDHKAGPARQQPTQCRPRLSEADKQRLQQSGEPSLDPRVAKVQDHLATRFRKDATPRQISRYYCRRRHFFGWPAYKNAPAI